MKKYKEFYAGPKYFLIAGLALIAIVLFGWLMHWLVKEEGPWDYWTQGGWIPPALYMFIFVTCQPILYHWGNKVNKDLEDTAPQRRTL